MADDLNINIGANPAGIESGSRRAKVALKGVADGGKALDGALRRLKSAIDPTFAAMEKYNKAQRDNLALMRAGVIDRKEYNAGMRAAKTALDAETVAIERNNAAGRAAAQQQRADRASQAQAARTAAAEETRLAREAVQARRNAARESAAAAKAAIAEEKASIRTAAAEAKTLAREVATTSMQAKREAAAAAKTAKQEEVLAARAASAEEKSLARESANAELEAKRMVKQAARDAAAVAKTAARERAQAERSAASAAREGAAEVARLAAAERQAANAAHEMRASIDPAYASLSRYNSTMSTATRLLMQNKLKQGEWIAIQRQAKAQMDLNVRSLGRQNSLYVQLGYQAQDVTASLASGINPLVILAQQGGQTAAALSTMGGTAGRVAAFFAGPWGAAIIGATLLLGYLWSSEKEGKDATIDLMDAESRRSATVKELTAALKDYVQQQKEANYSDIHGLEIKNNLNLSDVINATNKVAAAKARVKELEEQAIVPGSDPDGIMAVANMVMLGRANKDLAAAQTFLKTTTDSLTQSRTALIQQQGEQTVADQDHKKRVDALTDTYQASNQSIEAGNAYRTALRVETERYTEAKEKESAAHRANAKEVRDEARAYYTSRNDAISRAAIDLRNAGYDVPKNHSVVGATGNHPGMGNAAHADHAIDVNIPGGGTEANSPVLTARMDKMVAEYQAKGFRILWNGRVYEPYGGGPRVAPIPMGTDPHRDHVHMEAPAKLVGKPAGSELANDLVADAQRIASERKQALEESARDTAAFYDYQKELANDDLNAQIGFQQKKIDVLVAAFGKESKEAESARREMVRIERARDKEILQNRQAALEKAYQIAEAADSAEQAIHDIHRGMEGSGVDFAESSGVISAQQALQERAQILDQEYANQVAHEERMYQLKVQYLQKQLALPNQEKKTIDSLNAQLEVALAAHLDAQRVMQAGYQRDVQGIAIQAANITMTKWKEVGSTLSSSMTSAFQGIWTHSQTLQQGFINAADQMVYKFVDAGAKMFEEWFMRQVGMTAVQQVQDGVRTVSAVGSQAAQTTAVIAGTGLQTGSKIAAGAAEVGVTTATTAAAVGAQGIKTGAAIAGAATQKAVGASAGLAEIGTRAATSAAGAFSSTVVIPFIGPVAAPVAAAAALAAVLGFGALISARGGQGEVPEDGQLSMLHKKEMVLPAQFAVPLRQMLVSPRASSGLMSAASSAATSTKDAASQTSSAINFHYQPKHTNMGAGFDELLRKDGRSMRKWIKNEIRNGGLRFQ